MTVRSTVRSQAFTALQTGCVGTWREVWARFCCCAFCQGTPGKLCLLCVCGPENRALIVRAVKELVCGIISLLPALLHFGWICTLFFLREWYFTLTRRMETHSRYPPSQIPQQHFSSTYPSASSWNGFEIRSLLLLHSKFHACPFPPSLCLFPGQDSRFMLPAVPEKFKRRAVFLRVLMR